MHIISQTFTNSDWTVYSIGDLFVRHLRQVNRQFVSNLKELLQNTPRVITAGKLQQSAMIRLYIRL